MPDMPPKRLRPGEVVLTSFSDRRDRVRFATAYADPDSGITLLRPDDLIEANRAREAGETTDKPAFQGKLRFPT